MAIKRPGVAAVVLVGSLLTLVRTLLPPAPTAEFRLLLITLMLLKKTAVLISVRIGFVACIACSAVLFLLHFRSLKTALVARRVLFLLLLGVLPMYLPLVPRSVAIGRDFACPHFIAALNLPLMCKWF
jgi:hypothetical protein